MSVEVRISDFVKNETTKKIFAKVFDEATIQTIHKLSTKNLFKTLEYCISTGKEAHVFRGVDVNGNFRAIKVYKIDTSNFNAMQEYVSGDRRFEKVRKTKRDLVFAWCRKEHNNLEKMLKAGIRVPLPIGFSNNVLVMEFIGKDGEAAQPLKETEVENGEKVYKKIVEYIARMYFKAELVHGDLSEYNILMLYEEPVVIDVGQGVLLTHPKAKEFFERDVKNIARYSKKLGYEKSFEEVYEDVKAYKSKFTE